jgi:predicted transcriptional regulator of viral defense system
VADVLDRLGPVFRWGEASRAGLSDPTLYRLLPEGRLERISHGLYRQAHVEVADLDLVVVAAANGRSTLCLASALARHDLTDQIPTRIDVPYHGAHAHRRCPRRCAGTGSRRPRSTWAGT